MKNFCLDLREHAPKIITMKKKKEIILLKQKDKKMDKKQKVCYICKNGFSSDDNNKIRDHCHYTGKYRGAAHRTVI